MVTKTKEAYELVLKDLERRLIQTTESIKLIRSLLGRPETVVISEPLAETVLDTLLGREEEEEGETLAQTSSAQNKIVEAPNLETAVSAVLEEVGMPMRAREIAAYIKKAGRPTTIGSVYSACRKADVRKVGIGLWARK